MRLNEMIESLERRTVNEDLESLDNRLEDFIKNRVSDALDNIAIVIGSEIPEYDPSWCSEEYEDFDIPLQNFCEAVVQSLLKYR